MGIGDRLRGIFTISDEDEEEGTAPQEELVQPTPARRPAADYEEFEENGRKKNKVVNIHATTQLQVILERPDAFQDASEIADHLNEKRTVVLNLEKTDNDVARRLVDFLSGVAYANNGQIKQVANKTFIITPFNVDIVGDLLDELENNGVYF